MTEAYAEVDKLASEILLAVGPLLDKKPSHIVLYVMAEVLGLVVCGLTGYSLAERVELLSVVRNAAEMVINIVDGNTEHSVHKLKLERLN